MSNYLKLILRIGFWVYLIDSAIIKLLGILTCTCTDLGQPFNAWFFPAFRAWPYTSWFHYAGYTWLSGPYSLLWWALNSPAHFGYWTFYAYLYIVDIGLTLFLAKKSRSFTLIYATLSPWFLLIDPVDFWIVAFIFLGRFYWPLLPLAVLTKLPVGAPLWVWDWVLSNPNSLNGPENWGRYLILGCLFFFCLIPLRLVTCLEQRVRSRLSLLVH